MQNELVTIFLDENDEIYENTTYFLDEETFQIINGVISWKKYPYTEIKIVTSCTLYYLDGNKCFLAGGELHFEILEVTGITNFKKMCTGPELTLEPVPEDDDDSMPLVL